MYINQSDYYGSEVKDSAYGFHMRQI